MTVLEMRIVVLRASRFQSAKSVASKRFGDLSQFSAEKTGNFHQKSPQLSNPFLTDQFLNDYLRRHCPAQGSPVPAKNLKYVPEILKTVPENFCFL